MRKCACQIAHPDISRSTVLRKEGLRNTRITRLLCGTRTDTAPVHTRVIGEKPLQSKLSPFKNLHLDDNGLHQHLGPADIQAPDDRLDGGHFTGVRGDDRRPLTVDIGAGAGDLDDGIIGDPVALGRGHHGDRSGHERSRTGSRQGGRAQGDHVSGDGRDVSAGGHARTGHRLAALAAIVKPQKIQPAIVEFVDIAGLVAGASKGEGLGNQFLANIRETDAIAHVVRCFEDSNVIHVSNKIDPLSDIEVINTELALADMETVEKTMQREGKKAKSGDKDAIALMAVLDKILPGLNEAKAVRTQVGMTDVSTLAKFEISGPDAAAFLEIICATTVSKLAVGRGRYTFMLREDGVVFDDGTVWRLDENRYLLTSSTGGADRMATHISYVRQVLCPQMRVSAVNVQEHYAGIAVAGPKAKSVLAALIGEEPPRHMSTVPAAIAGVPVIILAASYSGERAFEIYVDASQAEAVWAACETQVNEVGGALYGLEAMEFLRIEKGHLVVGGEVDGRMTPHDLALDKMLNKAGGYIGASGLARPALAETGRRQLVGLEAIEGDIPEGAMLVTQEGASPVGHVSAAAFRIIEGGSVALGQLTDGFARHGEELIATSPTRGQKARVRVVAPHFYDTAGERYRD